MNNYQLTPYLLMRAPLLPVSDFLNEKLTDEKLKKYFSKPDVAESLLLSSPNLYEEWLKWKQDEVDDEERVASLRTSLSKYLLRMASRCTPFGMAAGYCLAEWDRDSDFILEEPEDYKRFTRLDMFLTIQIAKKLLSHEDLRSRLRYFPNSSLYIHNGDTRYIERITVGIGIKYEISQIEANEYLERILKAASSGEMMADLAATIVDDEVSQDEALEFVDYLIDSQLLVSELEPNLTGDDYFDQILEKLQSLQSQGESEFINSSLEVLNQIQGLLHGLDDDEVADNLALYDQLLDLLKGYDIEAHRKFLVRVDMMKKARHRKVSYKLASEVRKALKALNALSAPNIMIGALAQFKERFQKRYGTKEVPVLQALDTESGLGYLPKGHNTDPSPLVDDIPVHGMQGQQEDTHELGPLMRFLNAKQLEAIAENKYEIALSPEDFSHLESDWDSFHDSLVVMGSFLPDNKVFIRTVAGHGSAVGMLGRFSNTDEELNNYLLDITKHEADRQPDKILAEIVHLPQSRYGNVLTRTALRPYEIPFLARSVSEPEGVISLDDLTIRLNARNDMVLRSKRLNKEIVPRLASAHNYGMDSSLPVYHFLAELQGQNKKKGMFFRWAKTIEHPFKPRLSVGNAILARASWTFSPHELLSAIGDDVIDLDKVRKWREKWRLPHLVLVAESDREMLLNLEDMAHLAILKDFVRKIGGLHLVEFLFDSENTLVNDAGGKSYTNEFCATFLKKEDDRWEKLNKANPLPVRPQAKGEIEDTFFLGSEWVYYKLYMGMKTCDEFLAFHLPQLLESLKGDGLIDKWFFIRYNDPDYHIRLRFHLTDTRHLGPLLHQLHAVLDELRRASVVHDIVNDMYQREIERYGTMTMEDCETVFGIHSQHIIQFLALREESEHAELHTLLFGMRAFDQLFELLGMSLEEKLGFTERAFNDFSVEFNANKYTKGRLSDKYKYFSEKVEIAMAQEEDNEENLFEGWSAMSTVLDQMSVLQKQYLERFKKMMLQGQLQVEPYGFIWSINHMFANRLFTSKQRKHEFLLYAQLSRYYKIQVKRKR